MTMSNLNTNKLQPQKYLPNCTVTGTTGSPSTSTLVRGLLTYDVYTFTANGSITFDADGVVDVLVVGAASLGDTSTRSGGAGGVTARTAYAVTSGTTTITVGTTSGASSSFGALSASGGSSNGTSGNGWPGQNIQGGAYRGSGGAGGPAGGEGQFQASESRQGHGWASDINGTQYFYGAGVGNGPNDGQGGRYGDAGPTSTGSLGATNKGAVIVRVLRLT